MKKFEIKEIEILNSKVRFYKLIINKRCLYDEFEEEIIMNGNFQDELDTIQAIIERVAQMLPIPNNKFKLLSRNKKDPYPDYEIKSNRLRVYLFKQQKTGNIIVLGGIKTPEGQKKDIEKMRKIKKEYFNEV
jgi:hypothetical protein